MRPLIVTTLTGAIAASALVMSGCTTNAYTGEKQASKAAWGTAIGAAVGAAAGAATGDNAKDRRERALKGAAIGGVTGAGVGAYMDVQEKKLRERLASVGVGISKDKETGAITLIMPGAITFPSNQSNVMSSFYPVLDAVADVLKEYNKTTITVSGHTDSTGRADANMTLSQSRASAVSQYLISRGVAGARINSVGYGISRPVADNSTEAGKAQNRRVEVLINPPSEV